MAKLRQIAQLGASVLREIARPVTTFPDETVNAVIDDIITEMPLDDRVRTANLDEDGLLVLQLALGKYLQHLLKNQSEEVNTELFKDCIKHSGHLTFK